MTAQTFRVTVRVVAQRAADNRDVDVDVVARRAIDARRRAVADVTRSTTDARAVTDIRCRRVNA